MHTCGPSEKVNLRHLRGFRRFQKAALEYLKASPKAGDLKSLVGAYREAVSGERDVLGMDTGGGGGFPEQLSLRWLEDEPHGPVVEESV